MYNFNKEDQKRAGIRELLTALKEYVLDKNFPKTVAFRVMIFIFVLIAVIILYFISQQSFNFRSVETEKKQEVNNPVLQETIFNLGGTVQEIDKNSFILEATIPWINEDGQLTQKVAKRKVNITSATKIARLTLVSQGEKKGKTPIETPINFSDIKVGDYVEVISKIDISQVPEFEAMQIRFLPENL